MDKDTENSDDTVWCVDSETSRHYLLDRKTGQIVAEKDDNGNITFRKTS